MFVTDKEKLKRFGTDHRLWQGIPGIEVTPRGRVFVTYYSGGTQEQIGNFAVLVKADDGKHFSEPVAAAYYEEHRCYDPCLWIDPLGRLWFMWAVAPDYAVWGVRCDDPDAEELRWSGLIRIGQDVLMNKPTVLSTGEWLFPIAVWDHGITTGEMPETDTVERGSFVYRSSDNGQTFEKLGCAQVPDRSFDEHMILEMADGTLMMLVRTHYGIGVSWSYDRGRTWTEGVDSHLGGPSSRFFIRRLRSGRILLINHVDFTKRNNLTALLSDDEGKTWKYRLLLDERKKVAYPDAVEAEDGYIYITYDRERGAFKRSMEQVYGCAREILMAKITEADIMAGSLVSPESGLKTVISKLGRYAEEDQDPFGEKKITE